MKVLSVIDEYTRADLARKNGVSRARVTQILNLLRMATEVIDIIGGLGDPMPSPTVTERQLRGLINLPPQSQLKEITCKLCAIRSAEGFRHRS